jgi:head-tail adaptor
MRKGYGRNNWPLNHQTMSLMHYSTHQKKCRQACQSLIEVAQAEIKIHRRSKNQIQNKLRTHLIDSSVSLEVQF